MVMSIESETKHKEVQITDRNTVFDKWKESQISKTLEQCFTNFFSPRTTSFSENHLTACHSNMPLHKNKMQSIR